MHSINSDYQGIVDLLNALQLPLQIVTQAPSIPPDSNQVIFSTTIGTLKYSRLTSGSILLTDWQNSHAYISQPTHQLHLGERLRTHPHLLATVLEEFIAVAERTGADS